MKTFEERIKEVDFLIKEGKPSEAVFMIKEMIKIFPQESYLYYILGVARMRCGRCVLAKKALEKAKQIYPMDSANLRSLGWVKIMLGELEQGRKDLRESISLDLTDPLAYLDLAMSYFQHFEFEQGFEWLDRAKALDPQDPFILKNYEIVEKMKKDNSKYSEKEIEKMKQAKLDPKIQKQYRLFVIDRFIKEREGKGFMKDEIEEITEELKLNGLSPQITVAKDDGGPQDMEVVEYIKWHDKVKDVERKISDKEEKEITGKLFSNETSLSELKTCILRLAHQGTESSLKLLQEFQKSFPTKLKIWLDMAIDECESFKK